ncbi:MAG TPA: hypothetical protein PK808_09510, partial [Polymorphobacter sp.]|nr:hypothetical protein [Polymorphobacter sp.]
MTVVSLSHQAPPAKPGAAMDKPIERKRLPLRTRLIAGGAALLLLGAAATWMIAGSAGSQTIDATNVTISTVTRGTFDDFVPLRARVTPLV